MFLLTIIPALVLTQAFTAALGHFNHTRGIYDAVLKLIDTTGSHEWVAPGPDDQRGPCPALNALSNHRYIPHNGIASVFQLVEATNTVFGMGVDVATFLSSYGAVFDGDGLRFSIGGPDPRIQIPALGRPKGLVGSHNKYESDISPTRCDTYLCKNNYRVFLPLFQALYALQLNETEETTNYNLSLLADYRAIRFQQCIDNNPYCFNNIFSGIFVQTAAYVLQFRLMADHSGDPDFPDGRFSRGMLKSFFGVSGEYPDFKVEHGHERIPNNWHRRPDDYTFPAFILDLIDAAKKYPQFLSVGGNLGKTKSFTPVNLGNLTGGAYNNTSLLEPVTLGCFLYQLLVQQEPDIAMGLGHLASLLTATLESLAPGVTCPQLAKIDFENAFSMYPGYSNLSKEGAYT